MRTVLFLNGVVLSAFMFLLFFVIFVEIVLRATVGISLNYSWEVSCYLMAGVFFMGCAQAFARQEHIIVQMPMPFGPRLARAVKAVATLLVALALAGILYAVATDLWRDWQLTSRSFTQLQMPLFIAKLPLLLGIALSLAVVLVGMFTPPEKSDD